MVGLSPIRLKVIGHHHCPSLSPTSCGWNAFFFFRARIIRHIRTLISLTGISHLWLIDSPGAPVYLCFFRISGEFCEESQSRTRIKSTTDLVRLYKNKQTKKILVILVPSLTLTISRKVQSLCCTYEVHLEVASLCLLIKCSEFIETWPPIFEALVSRSAALI